MPCTYITTAKTIESWTFIRRTTAEQKQLAEPRPAKPRPEPEGTLGKRESTSSRLASTHGGKCLRFWERAHRLSLAYTHTTRSLVYGASTAYRRAQQVQGRRGCARPRASSAVSGALGRQSGGRRPLASSQIRGWEAHPNKGQRAGSGQGTVLVPKLALVTTAWSSEPGSMARGWTVLCDQLCPQLWVFACSAYSFCHPTASSAPILQFPSTIQSP